jgi:hypothetical protein
MGQLDIFAAQSVATERQRELEEKLRRRATSRTGAVVSRPRRRSTLLARLRLAHQPVV